MGSLLIDENPLIVLPTLARKLGLTSAIVLQQIHFLCNQKKSGKIINGHKWIWNTYEEWKADHFPFLSIRTIKSAVDNLRNRGLLLTCKPDAKFNKHTLYYRVNREAVELLASQPDSAEIAQSQDESVDSAEIALSDSAEIAQTGDSAEIAQSLFIDPETTSKTTKIAAIAATPKPARKARSKKTQPTEPEGDTQNGTSSPLQQSPIDDDISRAPAKTPDAPPVEPAATPRPRNLMFDKLAAMTHTTGAMAGPQIGKLIKQLKASHYDETHLDQFELWWCQDWRSKDKQGNRGIVPTVGQIGQLFGVAMAWAEKHAPRPAPIVEQLSPEDAAALEARLMAEYEANEAEMNRRRVAAGYIKA